MKQTKLICTLGPATSGQEEIKSLIKLGMDVARFNFSHGSHEDHLEKIKHIRVEEKKANKFVALLGDTKGPEVRVDYMEEGEVFFFKDDEVCISREKVLGNKYQISFNEKSIFNDVKKGERILIDDGKISLKVLKVDKDCISCVVLNDGPISSKKGVNMPDTKTSMPFLSEQDKEDIEFAVKNGFHFLALSFVRREEDVKEVIEFIETLKSPNEIELIAKIENQESYDRIEEILDLVDGIMVARGDLGVEIPLAKVPIYQKELIKRTNRRGKVVITATHMLESMMAFPKPTRAEASDVSNAVFDGTDVVMLSGETAVGKYPFASASTMTDIILETEKNIDYQEILSREIRSSLQTVSDVVGIAVSQAAVNLPHLKLIVAFTESGGTAKRISKFRPSVPIIGVCSDLYICHKLSLYWGTYGHYMKNVSIEEYDQAALKVAKHYKLKKGDSIAISSGWQQQKGATNTLRIIEIK